MRLADNGLGRHGYEGNYNMEIVLARVDDRLIHSKFVREWCGVLQPDLVIIIDEELMESAFKTNLYKAILPLWLEMVVLHPQDTANYLETLRDSNSKIILLSRTPEMFAKLIDVGFPLQCLTFSGSIYFPNKLKIPLKYYKAIEHLRDAGVKLYAISNPDDEPKVVSKTY